MDRWRGGTLEKPAETNLSGVSEDEMELLGAYRRAKRLGFADILVSVQNGARSKLWLTEKIK